MTLTKLIPVAGAFLVVFGATAVHAADENCQGVCNKVFNEAKKLPSTNARSVKRYGDRVVNQFDKCLNCAANKLRSTGSPAAPRPAPRRATGHGHGARRAE